LFWGVFLSSFFFLFSKPPVLKRTQTQDKGRVATSAQ
jgi:hypothetical protein